MRTFCQGAQGLFVPQNHDRIFTATSISRSGLSRQRGSRYATQQDPNYRPRDYATLAQSGLLRPLIRASVGGVHPRLPLAYTGQASARIPHLVDFARTCVFVKQSLPPMSCCLPSHRQAHLLANVRCQFAEFLKRPSLLTFVEFDVLTCVGLGTVPFEGPFPERARGRSRLHERVSSPWTHCPALVLINDALRLCLRGRITSIRVPSP